MKKYITILSTIAVITIPLVTHAIWWNPVSWFGGQTNSQDVTETDRQASPSDRITYLNSVIMSKDEEISNLNTQLASTTKQVPVIQTKIVTQTVHDNSSDVQIANLNAQITNLNTQISAIQNKYNICTNQLAAQNQNTQITLPGRINLSLDYSNPQAKSVSTTNGQYQGLPVLIFDVSPLSNADSSFHLHTVNLNITSSGQGTITKAYLYGVYSKDPIATAIVSNGMAIFNVDDIYPTTVGTQVFTIKIDASGIKDVGSLVISASVSNITVTDSGNKQINVDGSVQGKIITITNAVTNSSNNSSNVVPQTCPQGYSVGTGLRAGCCISGSNWNDVSCGG